MQVLTNIVKLIVLADSNKLATWPYRQIGNKDADNPIYSKNHKQIKALELIKIIIRILFQVYRSVIKIQSIYVCNYHLKPILFVLYSLHFSTNIYCSW